VKSTPVGSTELDDFHEAQSHGEHPDKRTPESAKEGQPCASYASLKVTLYTGLPQALCFRPARVLDSRLPHAFDSRPPCAPYVIEPDRQNEERKQCRRRDRGDVDLAPREIEDGRKEASSLRSCDCPEPIEEVQEPHHQRRLASERDCAESIGSNLEEAESCIHHQESQGGRQERRSSHSHYGSGANQKVACQHRPLDPEPLQEQTGHQTERHIPRPGQRDEPALSVVRHPELILDERQRHALDVFDQAK